MKTQIIHLERHDTLISTQDKMAWGQTDRILLVWPEDERILTRRIDLHLLHRHALAAGAEVGIVSQDAEIRLQASRLHIPTFWSVDQAQHSRWWDSHPSRPAPQSFGRTRSIRPERTNRGPWFARDQEIRFIRLFFAGIAAATLIASLILFVPKAQIQIPTGLQTQQAVLPIRAEPAGNGEVITPGTITYQTRSIAVEGQLTRPTTGTVMIPDETASGEVRFTNITDRSQVIPKGTVVRPVDNPNLRYATTREGTIPGGVDGTIDLPIQALSPGEGHNQPAGKIDTVEGSLAFNVRVTNPQLIQGGTDLRSPAATMDDRLAVKDELEGILTRQAWDKLLGELEKGDRAVRSSLTLKGVISETYDSNPDDPADHIRLSMKVEFETVVLPSAHLYSEAKAYLDTIIPAGYRPVDEEIHIEELTRPTINPDGTITWQMNIKRTISRPIDLEDISNQAAGLSKQQALELIQSENDLAQAPRIITQPSWWPTMPVLSSRIDSHLVDEEGKY